MRSGLIAAGAAVVLAGVVGGGPARAQGVVPCAPEGGVCRVPYPTTVVYGAQGRTVGREVQAGAIPCNNQVFGDPIRGVPKSCSYVRAGGRGGYDEGYGGQRRDYDRPRGYDGGYGSPRRYRSEPDDDE